MACAPSPVSALEERIAEKLGPQRYKIWFKNATRFDVADGFLKIGVPNTFIGGWIENHFSQTISEAAEEVVGRPLEIAYAIEPDLGRSLRRSQPDSQVRFAATNPERVARQGKRSGTLPPPPPLKGRFDSFIVGESNRVAFTCAKSAAESPASQFNPLFIHGGCGVGKTHLLQAVCNALKEDRPDLNWLFVSAEDFTNQYVYAVKSGNQDSLRRRYRHVDVLVIDDVHYFSNKHGTQNEFLHTFNAIDDAGRQIVLASDAPPKMIGRLSESLTSRFIAGMVVRIDPPDFETRRSVLRARAKRTSLSIPDTVMDYIAQNVTSSVRELDGAFLRLIAVAQVTGDPVTLSMAERELRELISRTVPLVRLTDIENAVAIYFGLTSAELHTSRKTRTISLARSLAMYLARKHTGMSFPTIGRHMGKDHSTVILACRRIDERVKAGGEVRWTAAGGDRSTRVNELIETLEGQFGLKNR